MISKVYAMYDVKANFYHPPIVLANDEVLKRAIISQYKDSDNQVSQFPEDFKIYCIGDYDDNSGVIKPLSPIRHVTTVAELIVMVDIKE